MKPLILRMTLVPVLLASLAATPAWSPLEASRAGEGQQTRPSVRDAERSFNLALKLEQAGNLDQAQAIYEQLSAEFPDNMRYYQRLKRLLRNASRYSDLLRIIRDHLGRHPDDIQSMVELGDAYLALGQKSQALQTWEGLLVRFPQHATAERLVLSHLLTQGLTEEGVALLERLRLEKGDPGFFALDLGRLYAARLAFDLATKEFLRYLSSQPQAVANVMNQLLRYPSDPETIAMLREQLSGHGSPGALRILAALEFKHRKFSRVVELHMEMETPHRERLILGVDLLAEKQWDLAEEVIEGLLADPEAVAIYERGILALAGIYEARSQSHRVSLPLSGFFPGNRFFALPYIGVSESQLGSLRQAIHLYDSLATTWQNPLARMRLGDIKFLILDDFDGAIADFEKVLSNRLAGQYTSEALLRLIDVWIAKGDLEAAGEVLHRAATRVKSKEDANLMDVKALELVFLSGDLDSLLTHVGGEMALLGPGDPTFNDLMELSGLVRRFRSRPEQYRAFVQSEALLRQNRRSEAIAVLSASLEHAFSSATAPVLQFRLANLLARQGNHQEAQRLCLSLADGTEFSELGLLLAAEIADYMADDSEGASEHYLAFLDTYPLSMYADAARLRYRVLHPETD